MICQVFDVFNGKVGIVECVFIKLDICGIGYFVLLVEFGVRLVQFVMYCKIFLGDYIILDDW